MVFMHRKQKIQKNIGCESWGFGCNKCEQVSVKPLELVSERSVEGFGTSRHRSPEMWSTEDNCSLL